MGRAARTVALLAGATLALAPPASAQGGNGLYEPFPKAAVEKRAKRFVERLRFSEPVRFSDEQLERGAFVDPDAVGVDDGLRERAAGAPSSRAGVDATDGGLPVAVQVAVIAVVVVALPLLAAPRPRRRVAPG